MCARKIAQVGSSPAANPLKYRLRVWACIRRLGHILPRRLSSSPSTSSGIFILRIHGMTGNVSLRDVSPAYHAAWPTSHPRGWMIPVRVMPATLQLSAAGGVTRFFEIVMREREHNVLESERTLATPIAEPLDTRHPQYLAKWKKRGFRAIGPGLAIIWNICTMCLSTSRSPA